MLKKFLLFNRYFEADKGANAGGDGSAKPPEEPAEKTSSALSDWRDARIHELNAESAARRTENKSLLSKLTERDGELAQLKATLTERERTQQEILVRSSVIAAAAAAGFHDPADAWNMLDKSGLKVAEGGALDGLDDALKKLGDSKPYLLRGAQETSPKPQPRQKPPSPGLPAGELRLTRDDVLKMSPEEIRDRWSDPVFRKAMTDANREA
jgi:hypothetical protein